MMTSNMRYAIFDWDDNIMYMQTKIKMERFINHKWELVELSTSEFREKRNSVNYRIPLTDDGCFDYEKAFKNFRDNEGNFFIKDIKQAIKNDMYGPSEQDFRKFLIEGRLFAIVTARGHEPSTLKQGVKKYIETFSDKEKRTMLNNLSNYRKDFKDENNKIDSVDFYLNYCYFIGVSSKYTSKLLNINSDAINPEEVKQEALKYITKEFSKYGKILNKDVEIGFSDDDIANIRAACEVFEKSEEDNTIFSVFKTDKKRERVYFKDNSKK